MLVPRALPPWRRRARSLGLAAVLVASCRRTEPDASTASASATTPTTTTSTSTSTPTAAPREALLPVPFEVVAADGVVLQGTLRRSPDRGVPLVVLVHMWAGTRAELEPLAERLARRSPAPHTASFDLRGHGASTRHAKRAQPLAYGTLARADFTAMADDLIAVARRADALLGTPEARPVVLVGSDLGATLVAMAAGRVPRVQAIALVSPGASIQGLDLYAAFARVRDRRTFVAAAQDDTVSKDPVAAIAGMARGATVRRYPGADHAAGRLGAGQPDLWADLAAFVVGAPAGLD